MYLEHANFTVADIERSVDFYSRVFGLRVRWRGTTTDGQPAVHIGDDRCYLALFQASETDGPTEANYQGIGFNHIGFVVDDLEPFRKRLFDQGITPHHEADYEPGLRLYFMDPDGIEVELVQYPSAAVPSNALETAP